MYLALANMPKYLVRIILLMVQIQVSQNMKILTVKSAEESNGPQLREKLDTTYCNAIPQEGSKLEPNFTQKSNLLFTTKCLKIQI